MVARVDGSMWQAHKVPGLLRPARCDAPDAQRTATASRASSRADWAEVSTEPQPGAREGSHGSAPKDTPGDPVGPPIGHGWCSRGAPSFVEAVFGRQVPTWSRHGPGR